MDNTSGFKILNLNSRNSIANLTLHNKSFLSLSVPAELFMVLEGVRFLPSSIIHQESE